MKIGFKEIKSAVCGAAYIEEKGEGIIFHRFTPEQEDMYKTLKPGLSQISSTAGVVLSFKTDSDFLKIDISTESATIRDFFSVDIIVNGSLKGYIDNIDAGVNLENYLERKYTLGRFEKVFELGSGTLADLGVHLIDMTRFLLGDFSNICAMSSTVEDKRMKLDSDEYAPVEVDDITSFVAKLKNGAIANFLVTKCAIGESNTIIYEIFGTEGVIKFNLNNPEELTFCTAKSDMTANSETVKVPREYFLEQEECFIDAVNGKINPYYPSVAEGASCQTIVDAALKSATEHIIVNF